jgi:hypothetical protein
MTYIFLHGVKCSLFGEASSNYKLKIIQISDLMWSIISIHSNSALVEVIRYILNFLSIWTSLC